MVTPFTKQRGQRRSSVRTADAPRDAAALAEMVRSLEAKLAAVSQRESDYQESVARIEAELEAAGALQRALLPTRVPDVAGLDVRVLFRPCSSVSGDVYDVFRIDESHVAFAIADATGHGVPAALLTTLIRRTLRGNATGHAGVDGLCPSRVLRLVNDELLALGLDDCQFVAVLYAVFDERSGVMTLARGGTPFPVLLRDGAAPRVIESAGPIVGATPDAIFEIVEFTVEPGDRLLFYTDGVESLIGADSDAASVGSAWARMASDQNGGDSLISNNALLTRLDDTISHRNASADDVTVMALERSPAV